MSKVNQFEQKLIKTQQQFKLSNKMDQKDNSEERIVKLVNKNQTLSNNIDFLLQEKKNRCNQLQVKIAKLIQSDEQNHLQYERLKIKYLDLKENFRIKINKIKQSIVQLGDIKESLNQQFNRISNFNKQILEQLQVFITQRKELEEMKRVNQQNYNLIKQLRFSQEQLIQEKNLLQKILGQKEAQFSIFQLKTKDIELQNQIDSEQLKQNIVSLKARLENSNNKFQDQKDIDCYIQEYTQKDEQQKKMKNKINQNSQNNDQQKELYFESNDCEVKSEYADENYANSKNDGCQIVEENNNEQQFVSEGPVNNCIENKDQNQQENIYLEGESYLEEDDTKKFDFKQQKLSETNIDLKEQQISQEIEQTKQNDKQDQLINTDENDLELLDVQFDDDFYDEMVQGKSDKEIQKVKLEVQTPLYNNINDFEQVQKLEENNQQSGWDFEGF
ncbi:unnamed protein product [Paramecium sonneborni]|uniref:Uncharacterized protein n=1 Tax=Paramecium sonneborni TaxID=65129 RepID=A0A8S1MYN0_9CILI|nr:unnamed protein product [Paramecium sonneborni]